MPQTDGARQEEGIGSWPSCDSLLNLPVGPCFTKTAPAPNLCEASPALGPVRQLRRKRALMQLRLASPSTAASPAALLCPLSKDISSFHQSPAAPDQRVSTMSADLVQAHNHNLTTLLTLSGEKLTQIFKYTWKRNQPTCSVKVQSCSVKIWESLI